MFLSIDASHENIDVPEFTSVRNGHKTNPVGYYIVRMNSVLTKFLIMIYRVRGFMAFSVLLHSNTQLGSVLTAFLEHELKFEGPLLFNRVDSVNRVPRCPAHEHINYPLRLPGKDAFGNLLLPPRLRNYPHNETIVLSDRLAYTEIADLLMTIMNLDVLRLSDEFRDWSAKFSNDFGPSGHESGYLTAFMESFFNPTTNAWSLTANSDPCLSIRVIDAIRKKLYPIRDIPIQGTTLTVEEVLVDHSGERLVPCAITTSQTNIHERLTIDPSCIDDLLAVCSPRFFAYLKLMAFPHTLACDVFSPMLIAFLRLQFVKCQAFRSAHPPKAPKLPPSGQ